MKFNQLINKRIVIWGVGKEGQASAHYIKNNTNNLPIDFIDNSSIQQITIDGKNYPVENSPEAIEHLISEADLVIKSPGVSLYHPLLIKGLQRGLQISSLLNLWLANKDSNFVIGVTGTKGKSTTASLLGHVLKVLGKSSTVRGNIGIPVTTEIEGHPDYDIIEVSSYQAAVLSGQFNVSLLTSLFPEHLDWHKSLNTYYNDKANLLRHSSANFIETSAIKTFDHYNIDIGHKSLFSPENWTFINNTVYKGKKQIGNLKNEFLLREHNRSNVLLLLSFFESIQFDLSLVLKTMKTYESLPHRQQMIGKINGIYFVDDSISTTPHSTIAAIKTYLDLPLSIIIGGFDRGVDYTPLIDYISHSHIGSVVCMGDSGKKIFQVLKKRKTIKTFFASSMQEAVDISRKTTPPNGVVLLSPASPSFDMYSDYIERASSFSKACGFKD